MDEPVDESELELQKEEEEAAWKSWATILEHAQLAWEAEVKNSDRQSARVNLTLTMLMAFFGVGIFRFGTDPFLRDHDGMLVRCTTFCLLFGLFLLGIAILHLLGIMGRDRFAPNQEHWGYRACRWLFVRLHHHFVPWLAAKCGLTAGSGKRGYNGSASRHLTELFEERLQLPPAPDDESDARFLVTRVSYVSHAATELQIRNEDERRRVDRGQQFFVSALFMFFLSVCFYTFDRGWNVVKSDEKASKGVSNGKVDDGEGSLFASDNASPAP